MQAGWEVWLVVDALNVLEQLMSENRAYVGTARIRSEGSTLMKTRDIRMMTPDGYRGASEVGLLFALRRMSAATF